MRRTLFTLVFLIFSLGFMSCEDPAEDIFSAVPSEIGIEDVESSVGHNDKDHGDKEEQSNEGATGGGFPASSP